MTPSSRISPTYSQTHPHAERQRPLSGGLPESAEGDRSPIGQPDLGRLVGQMRDAATRYRRRERLPLGSLACPFRATSVRRGGGSLLSLYGLRATSGCDSFLGDLCLAGICHLSPLHLGDDQPANARDRTAMGFPASLLPGRGSSGRSCPGGGNRLRARDPCRGGSAPGRRRPQREAS